MTKRLSHYYQRGLIYAQHYAKFFVPLSSHNQPYEIVPIFGMWPLKPKVSFFLWWLCDIAESDPESFNPNPTGANVSVKTKSQEAGMDSALYKALTLWAPGTE